MVDTASPIRFNVLLPFEQEGWHQTVTQLLQPQGVHTVPVRNGREALRMVESGNVHVAILDAEMPQLGGMQVIRRMNDLDPQHRPPAILLAHHLTNHLLQEALGMHVFSVLSKPVDLNLLLDALARVMRRYYESRWPSAGRTPPPQ